jgi:hypothetical protein
MQAAGSEAALSESFMKETAFCDTSMEGVRSGGGNRWRNGVIGPVCKHGSGLFSVITLVRCVHAHHPV